MSFKQRLPVLADALAFRWACALPGNLRGNVHFASVLHVEQLDDQGCFDRTLAYAKAYRSAVGKRLIATVMTPLSPLVAARLERSGFSPKAYRDRLSALGEESIIGLHGHFVRGSNQKVWPMHAAWHDMSVIEEQIDLETAYLFEHGLMKPELMAYSAGWWFSNRGLLDLLARKGYRWDFSLSANHYNFSPVAWEHRETLRQGNLVRNGTLERPLDSISAVCSIARGKRPLASFTYLARNGYLTRQVESYRRFLTFYSHDYDLHLDESIAMLAPMKAAGFQFFEPSDAQGVPTVAGG